MKKISLKNLDLQEVEVLSREQLRNVMGGAADKPVEDCCLVGAGGVEVKVSGRKDDPEYCQRLCDSAPLCTELC